MKTLGKTNIDKNNVYMTCTQTEKFRYPINDVILKRGKELVKTVLVTLSGKVLFQNHYKINGTFNHKTFNANHVRLTSSKHTRSLAAEGKFL